MADAGARADYHAGAVPDENANSRPGVDPHAETVGTPAGAVAVDATLTDAGRAGASASAPAAGLAGQTLAHFRLDALIGKGGMGEVYRATDLSLDRVVAIKVLPPAVARDERLRARFFREARSQARIQHPNVCHIYYIGEERGLVFFAMEHIDGESVAERLARGPVPVAEALEITRMAALGLREANRHGFTHRDVKPSNLMLGSGGAVKLVDFGLVTEGSGVVDGAAPTDGAVNKTAIVGTPLYMAPEQARGDAVNFRADLYALGATLHHMVAGAPPFIGDTPMDLVSLHLTEERPRIERRRRSRGPAPVDVLCDRMMAKQPVDRFADYDELVIAVEDASPARTRAAGFWVRAFALIIDALLVSLAMLPFDLVAPFDTSLVFPVAFLLYCVIAHGRFGRTLGKATLEIEVVRVGRRGPPGLGVAALRFAAQWGLLYAAFAAAAIVGRVAGEEATITTVFGVVAGAILLILYPLEGALTAWLAADKRTFWDRASGTRVCYRRLRD